MFLKNDNQGNNPEKNQLQGYRMPDPASECFHAISRETDFQNSFKKGCLHQITSGHPALQTDPVRT